MRKIGIECVEYNNRVFAAKILNYRLNDSKGTSMFESNPYFSPDIGSTYNTILIHPSGRSQAGNQCRLHYSLRYSRPSFFFRP